MKELISPPVGTAVSLGEVKDHLRLDSDFEDTYLQGLIETATLYAEDLLGRKLLTQTWKVTLDYFPFVIMLPWGPVQSIVSVKYYDSSNVIRTVPANEYAVEAEDVPGFLIRARDIGPWPDTYSRRDAVEIVYRCGYGAEEQIPRPIRQALLLLIAHFYANREAVAVGAGIVTINLPMAVDSLLAPYRDWRV